MTTTTHKLSIIVVTFNEAQHLEDFKRSCEALAPVTGVEVETLLVDGGSRDGTADLARQLGFDQVIELPGANIPVCRNRGAQAAKGDWLAYIDGDCELHPDWLQTAAPLLADPTPKILGWPVEPPAERTWVQEAWYIHWTHKNPAGAEMNGNEMVRHQAFRLITTRNVLLHRESYDAVGGFDEALSTGEDTDFVFRASLAGITVLGLPGLRVMHHGEPATLREFYRQQLWHANRSSYQRIMKHSGMKTGGRAPLFTGLFLIASLLFLAAPLLALLFHAPAYLALTAPLLLLVATPALHIALRAHRPRMAPSLCILYAAYGLARSLDLLGFFRSKASWKSGD